MLATPPKGGGGGGGIKVTLPPRFTLRNQSLRSDAVHGGCSIPIGCHATVSSACQWSRWDVLHDPRTFGLPSQSPGHLTDSAQPEPVKSKAHTAIVQASCGMHALTFHETK